MTANPSRSVAGLVHPLLLAGIESLLLLVLVLDPSPAADPGVAELGSRVQELRDRAAYRCAENGPGEIACRLEQVSGPAFEGLPLRGVDLYFENGKLARSCRVFDESGFPRLRAGLTVARGTADNHTELLRAGMAGSFTNEILVWDDGTVVTMLEQFHERVATSSLCLLDKAAFERLMSARAARRVRGVRDL